MQVSRALSRQFQKCFKGVSRVGLRCFKEVSRFFCKVCFLRVLCFGKFIVAFHWHVICDKVLRCLKYARYGVKMAIFSFIVTLQSKSSQTRS